MPSPAHRPVDAARLTGFDVAETIVRSGPGQVVTLIAGLAVARLIYLATERRLTGRAEAAIRP